MAAPPTIHTAESLRERCIEEGDCLIWQGYRCGRTPMVYDIDKMVAVRRIFTRLLRGATNDGGYYAPTCGNASCVEPGHTVWRSQAQHSAHMGTAASASASAPPVRRAKISNAMRRISAEAVQDICQSDEPLRTLAARHGISRTMVSRYKTGKSGTRLAMNPFLGLMR